MEKHIVLLFGGQGHEHEVSVEGKTALRRHFNCGKYRVTEIYIDKDGNFFIENADGEKYPTFPVKIMGKSGFMKGSSFITPDAVFPLLHGDFGEDGRVQGLLECASLPFVGEGVGVGALTSDKAYTKAVAERLGIPTARYIVLRGEISSEDAEKRVSGELGYPVFVKPTGLGSSLGASKAYSRAEFLKAYKEASTLGDVIAEELVEDKRELEVAYLNYFGRPVLTPPSEILCPDTYGYNEKYKLGTKTNLRAEVSLEISELARKFAYMLVREIGIFSLSRIDFFLRRGELLFNEINTLPGFTDGSMYLKMLKADGISEEAVIDALISRAGERR